MRRYRFLPSFAFKVIPVQAIAAASANTQAASAAIILPEIWRCIIVIFPLSRKADLQLELVCPLSPADLKSGYRISSLMASSMPSSVSGYMRPLMICWISFTEGVMSQ